MRLKLALVLFVITVIPVLQGCAVGVGATAATGAAVIYDRRATGTIVNDGIIEFKVLDAIRQDTELWNQVHVNATSYNEIVLLTGETPTEAYRTRTESLVQAIQNVRRVHNELAIAAPSSMLSRSSDTWVTGKVIANLLTEYQEEAARIKVVTENGSVYLMGLVSRAEAEAATNVARQVSGVQRVVKVFEYID